MKNKETKRIELLNNRRPKKILKFEKMFSAHAYEGKGKKAIETIDGKSVVAIAAPHSVNFFEAEKRPADAYTGALVRLLACEIGCHSVYIRKGYAESQILNVINEIANIIENDNIKVLIDLQLVDKNNDAVIELEKGGQSESDKYGFLKRAIKYSFEYKYRDKGKAVLVSEVERLHCSVTKKAADSKQIYYVYLGINKKYCDPAKKEQFLYLYNVLLDTLEMLSNLDWDAEKIKVYKLWQSETHKPQDKIEISFSDAVKSDFCGNSLLNVCTYGPELEKVRLHVPKKKTMEELENNVEPNLVKNEYVFLTNRLIEKLFDREWIEGCEQEAGLRDAPIIVYENKKEIYPIGLPKANQIDGVFFSSTLYDDKKAEATLFDYVIFNRYADSRLYIDFDKSDYADHGRVKNSNGDPAKKVMIPRYYKRLLGCLDYPLKMIRSEEYEDIIKILETEKAKAFKDCYKKIEGEIFYKLKEKNERKENEESDLNVIYKEIVIDVQKELGLCNNVEILRIPKEVKPKERLFKRIKSILDRINISILEKAIDKSEYLLKTEWTSETDDRNNIARLSPNMMSLLGVSENDKILVKFGKKQEILRVLANDELTDYQIGIPATARKNLGMNSVNDIVIVHRDMVHIFWRHSEEQTIAILGTVLAVFQVTSQIWIGVLLCIIVTPLIMYFVLNEERVKVK